MPGVPLETIRLLRDDILKLLGNDVPLTQLQTVQRDAIRTVFTTLDARIPDAAKAEPLTDAGRPAWDALPAATQEELQRELIKIRVTLTQLMQPGPTDPKSVMYRAHADNRCVYGLFGYSAAVTMLCLMSAICLWHCGTKQSKQANLPISANELRQKSQELLQAAKNVEDKRKQAVELRAAADKLKQDSSPGQSPAKATQPAAAGAPKDSSATPATGESANKELTDQQKAADDAGAAADVAAADVEAAEARMNVIAATAGHALSRTEGPDEFLVLAIVILLGATGGGLRLITSLVMYVGNAEFYRSWCLYYVAMPIVGAALAPLVYLLLRVGVLSPSLAGESDTASLNLPSIFMFAGLTGLFANQAMVKLRDVFEELFRTKEKQHKDPLGATSSAKQTTDAAR